MPSGGSSSHSTRNPRHTTSPLEGPLPTCMHLTSSRGRAATPLLSTRSMTQYDGSATGGAPSLCSPKVVDKVAPFRLYSSVWPALTRTHHKYVATARAARVARRFVNPRRGWSAAPAASLAHPRRETSQRRGVLGRQPCPSVPRTAARTRARYRDAERQSGRTAAAAKLWRGSVR